MATTAAKTLRVPAYTIRVDGADLEAELRDRVLAVTVSQDVAVADMAIVVFRNDDLAFTGEPPVALGAEIEVRLGFVDAVEPVMYGEVMAWHASFQEDGPATFSIRAYDRMHRLARSTRTRTFVDMKDSDIVGEIAAEYGLRAEVEDTSTVHAHVHQENVSDWEFLGERARRCGFEVMVKDRTLLFRPPRSGESPEVELEWGRNLVRFEPRLSASRSVSEVVVRGWDPKKNEPVVGRAKSGDERSTMEGASTGSSRTADTLGERVVTITSIPVAVQETADRIARSFFESEGMKYLSARGTCSGDPALSCGSVIKISGVGEKYSGLYYVHRADHLYEHGNYETRFEVRTNSVGRVATEGGEGGEEATAETETQEIEIRFLDPQENPVSGIDYVLTLPDGEEREGTLGDDGTIRADNLPRGSVRVTLVTPEDESGGSSGAGGAGGAGGSSGSGGTDGAGGAGAG